ncbi:MAG: hypothetical protein WCX93_01155 [Burkholderiaceae bacterium]
MLQQTDIQQAVKAYRETVARAKAVADGAILPEPVFIRFCTRAIAQDYVKEKSQKIPTGKRREDEGSEFIYVFSIAEQSDAGSQELAAAFETGRQLQAQDDYPGKKNLCQLNGATAERRAIYVGRSHSPRERFKQHLLESAGGTYGIHFQSWSCELHLHVEFFCYQFRGLGDLAAQVLEDGLWDHLKPILGKRGAR